MFQKRGKTLLNFKQETLLKNKEKGRLREKAVRDERKLA